MNSFPSNVSENIPGVANFWVVPVDDVNSISIIGQQVTGITFNSGKSWTPGEFVQDSLIYSEPNEETENGDLFQMVLKGSLAGDTKTLTDYFEEIKNLKFVVMVLDNSGTYKVFGSMTQGARFGYTLNKETNQFDYSFWWKSGKPAWYGSASLL